MPLDTLAARHARYRSGEPALVCGPHRLTHDEANRRANRTANALIDLGLAKGDRVALVLDNCLELLDLYGAAMKTGIVVVPLSPLLRAEGLRQLLADSGASAVVTAPRLAPELDRARGELAIDRWLVAGEAEGYRPLGELTAAAPDEQPPDAGLRDDDPFNVIYSSGTTGDPKGIVHTHRIREAYATGFASSFRIHRDSVVLHAGSLVFNGSFVTLMPALYLGCTYVLLPAFEPRAMIDGLAAEGVTHVMTVPSQLVALLQHDDFDEAHLPRLEMIGSLGAPLLLEHKQELMRRLPRRLYELYGLTEGFVTILDRDDVERKPGSVGVPPPLYSLRILGPGGAELPPGEVGEIAGRGPITMPGYLGRPELTADTLVDGWILSGDLGYVDDDGFLYLVDRKKDLIISGGVNVYPRDIEEVAVQHPDVLDVAVFGVPDEKWGESPIAAVRLRPGAPDDAEALREWINAHVPARYQRVREVVVREEFPTSVAGKTLRRVIREEYAARVTESRFVKANGIRQHYLDTAGDGPVLVLVPGLTANAHSLDGLLAAGLADRLRVLAFDARGRGLTERPEFGYRMEDHAADVLGALDELGLDRVVLGGHSFGGLLTYFVAANHPERVEKAVVLDAPAEIDPKILDQIAPSLARLDRTFASWDEYDAFIRSFPYWDGFEWNDDIQAYYRGDAEKVAGGSVRARARPEVIRAVIEGELAVDWLETVTRVACPTLLVRATRPFGPPGLGPIVPADSARRTVELLPQGRLIEVDGNHVTFVFAPLARITVDAIVSFVLS